MVTDDHVRWFQTVLFTYINILNGFYDLEFCANVNSITGQFVALCRGF